MPKILKMTPYGFPERVSSSHLSDDLNQAYSLENFQIENYCPTPCRGISDEVRKKYKNIKCEELFDGKIVIHRFFMFKEGRNPLQRAFRYLLVNVIQYGKGTHAEGIDLIYGASTPPTQGLLCAKVKQKLSKKYGRNVPFLYNLQDVFPDSLVNAKMAKKGSLIWKIGRKIEDYTYRSADKIIVISNDIKKNIMAKGVPEERIAVIPNWIDCNTVKPVERQENTLFDELGLSRDGFYVTYAGNLGASQSVDTILDAAELLKDQNKISFIIFGDGVKKEAYEKRIGTLNNVKFFPLMPQERVSEVYSLGDVSIVACKKGIGKGAIPSKTFSIMATATPIMLSFDKDSELWNLVKENNCGYVSDAENPSALANQISEAFADPEAVKQMGNNALSLVKREYSKEQGTQRYISLIKELTQTTD